MTSHIWNGKWKMFETTNQLESWQNTLKRQWRKSYKIQIAGCLGAGNCQHIHLTEPLARRSFWARLPRPFASSPWSQRPFDRDRRGTAELGMLGEPSGTLSASDQLAFIRTGGFLENTLRLSQNTPRRFNLKRMEIAALRTKRWELEGAEIYDVP